MRKLVIQNCVLLVMAFLLVSCGRTVPKGLGLSTKGQLTDCPDSPNCVSTQTSKTDAQIEPLAYNISDEAAWLMLLEVIEQNKLASIIKKEDQQYMHVAYFTKSKIFIDDVEFLQDANSKVFHFRSASRVGHSDLGANRKRMEKIRSTFLDKQKAL